MALLNMEHIVNGIIICWVLLIFCIGLKAMPMLSGWNQLVDDNSYSEDIEGTEFNYESAMLENKFYYKEILRFMVNPTGLGISFSNFLKITHGGVFIPWDDITAESEKIGRRKFIKLSTGKADCPIRISEALGGKIKETLFEFGKELIINYK